MWVRREGFVVAFDGADGVGEIAVVVGVVTVGVVFDKRVDHFFFDCCGAQNLLFEVTDFESFVDGTTEEECHSVFDFLATSKKGVGTLAGTGGEGGEGRVVDEETVSFEF